MSLSSRLSSFCRFGWNGTGKSGLLTAPKAARSGALLRPLRVEPLEDRRLLSSSPSFALSGPTSQSYAIGDPVPITWNIANLSSTGTVSLCYDRDSYWGNHTETWIEVDKVIAANGAATYTWDTSGIAPGTYYVGGYLYSNSQPTFSHLGKSVTVQSNATVFTLTAPSTGVYNAGQAVGIRWNAARLAEGSTVSLCYDIDSVFNGNEMWITVDRAAVNGTSSYNWDTTYVQGGTYYIGGYAYSNGQPTFSHFAESITILGNTPTFNISNPTTGTYTAGAIVPIQWAETNASPGSTVSFCLDTDTVFNGNERWIKVDAPVTGASGTYNWNTTYVTPGTYYIAGYLYSSRRPTYYHQTQAFRILAAPPMTFALTAPSEGTYLAGTTINIAWAATNVPSGSTISFCYDPDKYWNGNERWIKVDNSITSGPDGSGTYSWNTAGMPSGVYFIGGYVYSNGRPTYSHLSSSFAITNTLRLATNSAGVASPLAADEILTNQEQLAPVVAEAMRRWSSTVGSQNLADVVVKIADLPGDLLGETTGHTVLIDQDAAGYGWFIDPTPANDVEFSALASGGLVAQPQTAADRHADLLTTVMHELGHVLGYQDAEEGLMGATLPLSVRWPTATDRVFAT